MAAMSRPLVNYTNSTDEWFTPKPVLREVLAALGLRQFDLDVASPAIPTVPARQWYAKEQDGLSLPWAGIVWCNPPYSETAEWCRKALEEVDAERTTTVIGLLPANPDTAWFHDYVLPWPFWVRRHRIHFCAPDGKSRRNPKGSVLVAWTRQGAIVERLRAGLETSRWRCNSPKTRRTMANCNDAERAEERRFRISSALRQIQREIKARGVYTARSGRTITRLGNPSSTPAQHLQGFAGSRQAADARRRQADDFALRLYPILLEIIGPEPWDGILYARVAGELEHRAVPTARRDGSWNRGTVHRLMERIRRLQAEGRFDAVGRPAMAEGERGSS